MLFALTHRIRLATGSQLGRTSGGPGSTALESARKTIATLERAGFAVSFQVRAHPELSLEQPICTWKPGSPTPAFGVISYRLRVRWIEAPEVITVYAASEKAARRFAGHGGRLPHPLQATHDLHMTGVFLQLRERSPEEAALWVPEEKFANKRRGQKLPDAEIQDEKGRTLKVIEFGGSYSPERVRKVHEDCERRSVPYELW